MFRIFSGYNAEGAATGIQRYPEQRQKQLKGGGIPLLTVACLKSRLAQCCISEWLIMQDVVSTRPLPCNNNIKKSNPLFSTYI